jgi:3-methylcrotonyl-CoA carboxylase alpha subunit
MRLRCGDRHYDVEVRAGAGELEVRLAGRALRFALVPAGPGVFVVRTGTHSSTLHLARDGPIVHLAWEGVAYAMVEEREGARPAHRIEPGALEAPMPGRVSAVKVAPGQRVLKGEEVVVVEAMKMENALRAPADGVVRAVHVAVGDAVAPGPPLVELE